MRAFASLPCYDELVYVSECAAMMRLLKVCLLLPKTVCSRANAVRQATGVPHPSCCSLVSAPRRHLSSRLFTTPHATFHPLYDFLRTLQNNGKPMMVGKRITCVDDMQKALSAAEKLLQRCDAQVQLSLLPRQVLRSAGAEVAGHLSFISWPNRT